jgi:hypothetical protein
MNKIIFFYILLTAAVLSCSGRRLPDSQRYEGLAGTNLRVAVKIDTGDEDRPAEKEVLSAARGRAIVLLSEYAAVNVKSAGGVSLTEQSPGAGKIVSEDCYDEYCIYFVDFDAANIVKKINPVSQ